MFKLNGEHSTQCTIIHDGPGPEGAGWQHCGEGPHDASNYTAALGPQRSDRIECGYFVIDVYTCSYRGFRVYDIYDERKEGQRRGRVPAKIPMQLPCAIDGVGPAVNVR